MEQFVNFIKGDSIGSETDYRDSLPVNMHGVVRPMFGAAGYMIQSSGLSDFGDTGKINYGGIWNERFEKHFRVAEDDFVEVDSSGNISVLGQVNATKTVSLPYSFNTQGIVADNKFYLYDPAGGFREVTDTDLGNPIDCVWINGYYCFTDGEFIYHTDITDESSIDPLKFATAEFMPDPSLGCAKSQDNKWIVFGRYTTEYFVDTASDNFAFTRIEQRAVKIGIVGTHCKAELEGDWYLMGGRKEEAVSVHVLGVGGATKVATREVEKVIGKYTEIELRDSVLNSYEEDGYSFLIVHLPNDTLLFNKTLASQAGIDQAWTILKSENDSNGDATNFRGIHPIFEVNLGQWIFGDKRNGNIGIWDNTVATQYGEICEWLLFTPFMYLDSQSIDYLEVEVMPGHNIDYDASVFLSLTYDGVFHGNEWKEMYGNPNDYSKRFIIRRLGYVRDWVGMKLRGATRSRMAFGRAGISYG